MPLLPRWRYMSADAKAITLRVGWSALAVVVVAIVLRPLLPWLALTLILYFMAKASLISGGQPRDQRLITPDRSVDQLRAQTIR